jgi:hypothetical protein
MTMSEEQKQEKKPRRKPFEDLDCTKLTMRSRPSILIDGASRRRIGVQSDGVAAFKAAAARGRPPKAKAAPVAPPPPPPPLKGKGKKKPAPVGPADTGIRTEYVDHEWGRQPVRVRNGMRERLSQIGSERYLSECVDFAASFEMVERGIRAQNYEMGVDGGQIGASEMSINKIEASAYLKRVKEQIGEADFDLLVVFVWAGCKPKDIAAAGGHDRRIVAERIRAAIGRMVRGKNYQPDDEDRTVGAVKSIITKLKMGMLND